MLVQLVSNRQPVEHLDRILKMKFLFVTICVIGAVAVASAQTFGRGQPPRGHMQGMQGHGQPSQQDMEQARRAQQMVQRCQMQEKATETDISEFSQQRRPSTETGKCLHACLMESVGLISNGAFSVENSIRFMSQMAHGNNEVNKIVQEISKDCESETDSDRCELAYKIMTCTEEGIKKRQDELRKYMPRGPPPQ